MPQAADEDDDASWLRPVWETDEDLEPPGRLQIRPTPKGPGHAHPLLAPLARAQDAVARLESRVEAAPAAIAEGLRARLAYREAAGWLAYSHVWIHPRDLALRDATLTSGYAAAFATGQLEAALPATTRHGSTFDVAPSDYRVNQALQFARLWRRLAELRTWKPLANAAALKETLGPLGCREPDHASDIEDWLASIFVREEAPALIRAARAARAWMNLPHQTQPLSYDGIFLAACLWRQSGFGQALSLPF